ncbi:hypothetical protein [Pseudodonghicola xiamenensis]|uniref:Uncharacterized protein n=1 Tax=Pseudodonghicola xiamenensis TaxID=337702 RepID=A0A8J3MCI8_9RHOB|nr:hypothetical protein [Pseudodonghicola xiamenensis]GHG84585.1 hypothetical protein GCM10010961_10890 [Pseudodonghicola xiamenensis]
MSMTHFPADRTAYVRAHLWLALGAMAGATLILWLIGNPYVWTGLVAGAGAIALRGFYLASEELAAVWAIEGHDLTGPGGQRISLARIETIRTIGSFVQVITRDGHKYLIKYQADPQATMTAIERARA